MRRPSLPLPLISSPQRSAALDVPAFDLEDRPREECGVVGISGIVGGAPLAGMADRLMPVAGVEVTAAGAAECYRGLLGGWVVDEADRSLVALIQATGLRVGVTDTIMTDDAKAEDLARFALGLLR